MNKKGFLLVDSLMTVFIVTSISVLCIGIFRLIDKYEYSYTKYQNESNERLEIMINEQVICEGCLIKDDN